MLASLASAGCGHRTWHYALVPNVTVPLPEMTPRSIESRRAGQPPEPLEIAMSGDQSVLVASLTHDNPQRDLDEWGRVFVIVLDGGIPTGRVEVTPENGRLIAYERLRPARRPYTGLDGYITILSVNERRVRAYCAVRSRSQYTNEETQVLRGVHEFRIATGAEAFLNSHGIRVHGPPGMESSPEEP